MLSEFKIFNSHPIEQIVNPHPIEQIRWLFADAVLYAFSEMKLL